ncbi:MAG: hypothetical protein OQJ96_05830 [Flavobacteriales bacterium]|nr:hypothetical protein [Flavobacteriales bacterium]MCW8911942.1 hypothetical protein [Flavobacteriales bacterium]MCW8937596.1 hypothetical protein [Flavobacteriales bacterium]MCW8941102.1 hypothetical protein [Flavobacteriales bacterium]MCW8968064.1 hypothetical protein [Flavobacteriales bacterium]
MDYYVENYTTPRGGDSEYKVLVVKITAPCQVLQDGEGSIHQCIIDAGLSLSVGLYFYRFKTVDETGFTKIGEVSNWEGIIKRKKRGWLSPESYSDTYKGKVLHEDVESASESNPMYFVFYGFDESKSFPKIDEIRAFHNHKTHFKTTTRNREGANSYVELGSKLVWYPNAFEEVLNLKLPSGRNYP